MNYFVLNSEKNEFWLTPAVRQDFGNEGGVMALKLCSGIATRTPTPTPSPATPTPSTSTPSSTAVASGGGTPVGAIVGGVVGGVCALALIGLLAFLLLRRRKRVPEGG